MKDETRKKGYMDTIMLLGCLVDPIERKNALRNCADLGDFKKLMLYEPVLSEIEIREIKLIWFASRKGYTYEMHALLEDPQLHPNVLPVPSSAVEWAAYHGNAVITWWIVKTYQVTSYELGKSTKIAMQMRVQAGAQLKILVL
jgi:hypothetical protein